MSAATLSVLPAQLPAPYRVHERGTDQYGYVTFGANYYWVPGSQRADLKLLEYSDRLKLYLARQCLAEYPLPAQGVRNQQFHPPGQPAPPHHAHNRKHPTEAEEKHLRALDPAVSAHLDFALPTKGIQRHELIRRLWALSRQASIGLLRQTRERARKYRITDWPTVERIAQLYLQQGAGQLPLPLVDESFRQRETYQQGLLTDLPNLSHYEDPPDSSAPGPEPGTHWDDYLKLAAQKGFSHAHLLTHVLAEEARRKRENARQLRLKHARIPEPLVLETYPFERQPKLNKKRRLALYDSLGYMRQHQNLIGMGITGCGKTGLATRFLIHAIDHGYRGRYVLFADLVGELYHAVADHSETKVLKKYLALDCLLIDEMGYLEVEPVQVGLFFTLMHQRHKTKSTLITSNLGFAQWGSFLKNDNLTAALIDRLTETSHVINLRDCVGIRPKLPSEP